MQRTYDNAIWEINQLTAEANQLSNAPQKQTLIDKLNDLIFQYDISDKSITYASEHAHFASWNIACGSKWVNALNGVGPSTAPRDNPTLNNPSEHIKRMKCCMAIIGVLKKAGINAVVLQEAPKDPKDLLYHTAVKGPEKDLSNISLAAVGDHFSMVTNPNDQIYAELIRLMKDNGIKTGEMALFKNNKGEYFIDMHLNYADAKNPAAAQLQQTLLKGLHTFCSKHNVIAAGDSNMKRNDVNEIAHVYGARGCLTTDIMMSATILQQKYIAPPEHPDNKLPNSNPTMNITSTTTTTSATSATSSTINIINAIPATSKNGKSTDELIKYLGKAEIIKGKSGMVQFRFDDQTTTDNFLHHLQHFLKDQTTIVSRTDSPLVIRLEEKKYNELAKKLGGLFVLAPYHHLPYSSFEKTSTKANNQQTSNQSIVSLNAHDIHFLSEINMVISKAINDGNAKPKVGGKTIILSHHAPSVTVYDSIADIWTAANAQNLNEVKRLITTLEGKEAGKSRPQTIVDIYKNLISINNQFYPKATAPNLKKS